MKMVMGSFFKVRILQRQQLQAVLCMAAQDRSLRCYLRQHLRSHTTPPAVLSPGYQIEHKHPLCFEKKDIK
jgi:hypothetical protein